MIPLYLIPSVLSVDTDFRQLRSPGMGGGVAGNHNADEGGFHRVKIHPGAVAGGSVKEVYSSRRCFREVLPIRTDQYRDLLVSGFPDRGRIQAESCRGYRKGSPRK